MRVELWVFLIIYFHEHYFVLLLSQPHNCPHKVVVRLLVFPSYYKCTEECETQPEAAPEGICTMRPDEISRGPKASSTRFGPRTFTITFSMSATAPAVQSLEGVQL